MRGLYLRFSNGLAIESFSPARVIRQAELSIRWRYDPGVSVSGDKELPFLFPIRLAFTFPHITSHPVQLSSSS